MNWPQLHTISISAISDTVSWSLHQDLESGLDDEFLESVRTFGVVRPPLVRQIGEQRYQLICGSRRLRAIAALNCREALCLLLNPALADHDLLQLAVRDQSETAPLSPIETARLLLLAQRRGVTDDHIDKTWPPFPLKNRGNRQRLVRLLELEPDIRQAIHNGAITARTGFEFASLSPEDRLFLCRLFRTLAVNGNKQQRIVELGRIIVVQEKTTFKDLFTNRFGYCLTGDDIGNSPQIISRLLRELYRCSHPLSSEAQLAFTERVAALKLPEHCTVTASTSFEQDRVTLAIELESLGDLEKKWPKLKTLFT